ncbi:MAG: putative sulfate exporter family transporter [Pseudomonadales bacterium]
MTQIVEDEAAAARAGTESGRALGWGLCAIAVPVLVWQGNPAVALLVGSAIALILNRTPLSFASRAGKYCLQTAIVLLGLRLDLKTVWGLSAAYTGGVAIYVVATLTLGLLLGWLFRVEGASSKLMSSGTAICGGTTIATLSGIVNAAPHQTGVALAIVFLMNAVALFLFPFIGHQLDMSQLQFGLWSALAIHDTSSVVATAAIYGDEAAKVATTIKLGRTLWLIPLVFAASLYEHSVRTDAGAGVARLRVPGFILMFLLAVVAASFLPIPELVTGSAGTLSKALLVLALFFIGTEISRATVRRIRGRVLWQALLLWLLVAPSTLAVILWLV